MMSIPAVCYDVCYKAAELYDLYLKVKCFFLRFFCNAIKSVTGQSCERHSVFYFIGASSFHILMKALERQSRYQRHVASYVKTSRQFITQPQIAKM